MSKTPRTCKRWSPKENEALLETYKHATRVDWGTVAFHLFEGFYIDRTPEACRKQWEKLYKKNPLIPFTIDKKDNPMEEVYKQIQDSREAQNRVSNVLLAVVTVLFIIGIYFVLNS